MAGDSDETGTVEQRATNGNRQAGGARAGDTEV